MARAGYTLLSGHSTPTPLGHTQTSHPFYDSVSGTWFCIAKHSDSDMYIHKWSGTEADNEWTRDFTTTCGDRNSGQHTCWWDDANRTLHVIEMHHSQGEYYQQSYNGTSWSSDVFQEVVDVHSGVDFTASIVADSNGVVWVAFQKSGVWATRYRSGGSWTNGPNVGSYSSAGDSRGQLVQYEQGGSAAVGLAYSEDVNDEIRFSYRLDSAGLGTAWTDEQGVDFSTTGGSTAEGHVHAVGDGANVVVAYKRTDDTIHCAYRDAGSWSNVEVDAGPGTRPKVVLDGTDAHVIWGDSGGVSTITRLVLKPVTLATMSVGSQTTMFESASPASGDYEDPSVPAHAVDNTMSPAVVLGDRELAIVEYNVLTVSGGGGGGGGAAVRSVPWPLVT